MAFNQGKYIAGFMRENYDEIKLLVPKGKRELLRKIATERNIVGDKGRISVNRMIIEAVEQVYGIDLSKTE